MDKAVESIIRLLNEEKKLYKDLVQLSNEKKNAIIAGRVEKIDKIVKIEQNIVFDVGQLEKERELEVDRYCIVNGIKRDSVNITELVKFLGPEAKMRLESVQQELNDTLSELKRINDQNGELIKQAIEYIDFSIGVITSSQVDTSSLYEEGKQTKRIFDAKI